MPTQIEKLEAHASHLLDAFIGLREKYALLQPMLFDKQVVQARGSFAQARGFQTLRHSLFLSCAQDIAKLCLDADKRTPSILNLVSGLSDLLLRGELRERYAIWKLPSVEGETDPEIIEALRRIEQHEQSERRAQLVTWHSAEHPCGASALRGLDAPTPAPAEPETIEAFLSRVLGADVNPCPHCGEGRLRPIRALPPLPRATGPPLFRCAALNRTAGPRLL